ncbi:MAG: hypothetical protein ABL879_06990 [Devosia sp.]
MLAAAYLLFVLSDSGMPALTALAAYETAGACNAAKVTITAALGEGDQAQHVACISADSLRAFGDANKLGED